MKQVLVILALALALVVPQVATAQVVYSVPLVYAQPVVAVPTVPVYPVWRYRAPVRNALFGPLYYTYPVAVAQPPAPQIVINQQVPPAK